MSTHRPEFVKALQLLAKAFDEVVASGFERPIIVGGAAVEFYTGGAVVSGDFDVISAAGDELYRALLKQGFERPSGPGALLRGVHHPALGLGVEIVSGQLFDGASDKARVRIVSIGANEVRMLPVEDLIADRMGQFAAPANADLEMLGQAVILYRIARQNLADPLDEEYLDARIRQETAGSLDLAFLIGKAGAADHA